MSLGCYMAAMQHRYRISITLPAELRHNLGPFNYWRKRLRHGPGELAGVDFYLTPRFSRRDANIRLPPSQRRLGIKRPARLRQASISDEESRRCLTPSNSVRRRRARDRAFSQGGFRDFCLISVSPAATSRYPDATASLMAPLLPLMSASSTASVLAFTSARSPRRQVCHFTMSSA